MNVIQSRYWIITSHIQNMKNAGLSDEQIQNPQYVADFFLKTWNESGKDRIGDIVVCKSSIGTYHVHGALCGEKTTLNAVAKLMFNSHVEPCKGGKKALLNYIHKVGKYKDKNEIILAEARNDCIVKNQGYRSDLERMDEMFDEGMTPDEIIYQTFPTSSKYEKCIINRYEYRKRKEAPLQKPMYVEWHIGETNTGKSHISQELSLEYGANEIFTIGHMKKGWVDDYVKQGCAKILFIDDLSPPCSIHELLRVLDSNPNKSIEGRYKDTYPLWDHVYITSLEPPEDLFRKYVKTQYYKKLIRSIDYFVYHFIEDHRLYLYRLPSDRYIDYDDLMKKAINKEEEYAKTIDILIVDSDET